MKKTYFKALIGSFILASAFSCSQESLTQATNADGKPVDTSTLTIFSTMAGTRTTGIYDSSKVSFFWTSGDHLWLNNNGTLQQDSANNIDAEILSGMHSYVSTAKFWFAGTLPDTAYIVRYTGNESTSGSAITIATTQTQIAPNFALQLGTSGDCGVATAIRNQAPTDSVPGFTFSMNHLPAYATFIPYYSLDSIPDIYLTKIKISAHQPLAGLFTLTDSSLVATSSTDADTSIVLNMKSTSAITGFSIPKAMNASINATTMVLAPGTYTNVTITYTLYDVFTKNATELSRHYGEMTFTAGKNKLIHPDLSEYIDNYDSRFKQYYLWDAKKYYYYGLPQHTEFEPTDPTLIPGARIKSAIYIPYTYDASPNIWANINAPLDGSNVYYKGVYTCSLDSGVPNYNGLTWYLYAGDPHIDTTTPWILLRHLFKGGLWLKKQAKIPYYSTTDKYSNAGDISNDITYTVSSTSGTPQDTSLYFYLPAMGEMTYPDLGDLEHIGDLSYDQYYWTSSSYYQPENHVNENIKPVVLRFNRSSVGVTTVAYMYGNQAQPFK